MAGFLGIAGTVTSVAVGQDKLGAQALFDEAKHLMDTGKTAEACPKFEASLQLDSNNTTTLMSLAQCYEKLGRLASAYLTYRSAESEATDAEQTKRAKTAHDKAEKLFPKLSRLTIRVTPEANVKGLQVSRNGMNVAPAIWGTPIPVDPGQHEVVAQVGGKKWKQRVDVGGDAAQVFIDIPAFAPTPAPVVAPVPKAGATGAARPAATAVAPAARPVAVAVAPRPTATAVATVVPKPSVAVAPVAPIATVAPKAVAPVATVPPKPTVAAVTPPAPKALAAAPITNSPVQAAPKTNIAKAGAAAAPMLPAEPRDTSEGGWLTQQTIGIGVASLGVVGLGVGTYFVLRSNSKESTASAHCPANECDPVGFDANNAALSAKKAATWSYIAGGALVAGGVVLILTEPKRDQVGQLQLHPFVASNAGSLTLTGLF